LIGYWLGGSGSIDQMDLSGFSAVKYAFMFVDGQGQITQASADDYKLISILNGPSVRGKYPSLRTVLSIGGWTGGRHFSSVAASPDLRVKFAKNVHEFLDKYGFDGVDVDWEFPYGGGLSCNELSPDDVANFALLLAALRAELGPTRHISIAVGAVATSYSQNGRNYVAEYAKSVSYLGVMTYDLTGSWSPSSDFNSALGDPGPSDPQEPPANHGPNSIQSAIQGFIAQGVSSSQLVGGLAFYGRSWSVSNKGSNNGLFMSCANSPNPNTGACPGIQGDYSDAGGCDTCGECGGPGGTWNYNALRGAWGQQQNAPLASGPTNAVNGWSYQYFGFAASATLFSPSYNGISNVFISYDDTRSIQAKTSWMRGNVGGAMIWQLGGDFQGELTGAARAGWGN
ncbi:glycoside hydrolase, partial [Rhizoclosmatium globosum]